MQTLDGFQAWKDFLRSCHSISIGYKSKTLIWPLQNLNLFFLDPFRGGLAGVFGITILLHKCTWAWGHKLTAGPLQDFLIECRIHGFINYGKSSRSWRCKAAPDHHTFTTTFDCWYDVLLWMLCWFYSRCNGTHAFQKLQLLSHQSTEYLPKSLGDNQDIVWQMWDEPLCYLWSAVAFALEFSHGCRFSPSLFLIVELWTQTLIEASEACSSSYLFLGSFMTSWMSRHCALGVILVGRLLMGRFTTFPNFLHLWIMALTVVRWSPRNGVITLSRLIHVTILVCRLFLNFFRSLRDVFLFKHASLCQTGSI